MDDIKSNAANDANTKIKDGYTQLAEKVDQVKNQVARMERKYDELFQAVKEKDSGKTGSVSHEIPPEPQEMKTHRESMLAPAPKQVIKSEDPSPKVKESREEVSSVQQTTSPTPDMDIEKMEDNPFV